MLGFMYMPVTVDDNFVPKRTGTDPAHLSAASIWTPVLVVARTGFI
jgi:hypothetical protein